MNSVYEMTGLTSDDFVRSEQEQWLNYLLLLIFLL